MRFRTAAVACMLVACATTGPARAADRFLVIGGGYAPEGNQVSLEKNVLLFRRLLGEYYPSGVGQAVLFSDGDDPGRDLQFLEPESAMPRVNVLLARVFDDTDSLGESYRSHAIPGVRGASTRAELDRWFATEGRSMNSGDRLVLYVTAHGGKGSKEDPRNTVLYLWGHEELHVKELAGLLESLPRGVRVVLVMVQCYSGGFAELAFRGGDRERGPSGVDVCGFFATTHDRPAAGCTPDIDEENYHEYSSYFWEAVRGRTRTGQPIARDPDLDGDGAVSFAEAHAYTLLESVTVDIPVKTSDAFLRRFSRASGPGLLTSESPFDALLAAASGVDRAVLEGLSRELGLTGSNRAAEARARGEAALGAKRQLDRQHRNLTRGLDRASDPIEAALLARWPELKNRWNPRVTELLTTEADAVVEAITSHPGFAEFEQLRTRLADVEARQLDQDRLWVKCQRLLRTLESVALAANLPRVADAPTRRRYRRLLDSEAQSLGPRPAAPAAALTAAPGEG